MPKGEYEIFEALNLFFEVVMEGLRGLADGDYYFDTIAEDAFFEFRYRFPAADQSAPKARLYPHAQQHPSVGQFFTAPTRYTSRSQRSTD